jgi:hypothetical protein
MAQIWPATVREFQVVGTCEPHRPLSVALSARSAFRPLSIRGLSTSTFPFPLSSPPPKAPLEPHHLPLLPSANSILAIK